MPVVLVYVALIAQQARCIEGGLPHQEWGSMDQADALGEAQGRDGDVWRSVCEPILIAAIATSTTSRAGRR